MGKYRSIGTKKKFQLWYLRQICRQNIKREDEWESGTRLIVLKNHTFVDFLVCPLIYVINSHHRLALRAILMRYFFYRQSVYACVTMYYLLEGFCSIQKVLEWVSRNPHEIVIFIPKTIYLGSYNIQANVSIESLL